MPSRPGRGTFPLALLALQLASSSAFARAVPDFQGYVVDQANIIDVQSRMQITMIASALDHEGLAQLAVCTVPDLGDESKEEFAVEVFKKWGLGHGKQRSDGVLVLLVPGQPGHRKIKVEVGYGMEGVLPDGKVGAMIREVAVPHLAQDEYGAAALGMIANLAQVIRSDAAAGGDSAPAANGMRGGVGVGQGSTTNSGDGPANPYGFAIVMLAMCALIVILLVSAEREQFPGSRTTIAALALVAAALGGAVFFGGAFAWVGLIAGCIGNGIAWIAIRGHKCPKCGGWVKTESRVTDQPTLFSTGIAIDTERCTRCDYGKTTTRVLPRTPPPVIVTSGGGGSDWGGGGGGWGGGGGGGDSGGGFSGGGGGESGGGGAGADV